MRLRSSILRPSRRLVPMASILAVFASVLIVGPSITPGSAAPGNPWLGRRVLSIAHAGGEDEAPHETMFAYKRAAALGTDVLEMDVQLSADGVLVVHHDATVNATTNGTGRVDSLTYDQLFALDHGYKFTPQRWSCSDCAAEDYIYRGIRTGDRPPPVGYVADDFTIPTLEAIFEQFPDQYLDIEIKSSGEPARAAARELARLIDTYDRADQTVMVSFDDTIVDYFKTLAPDVDTSPGTAGVTKFFTDRKPQPQHRILQVPPEYEVGGAVISVVTKQFVDDAHAAGLAVWVWMNSHDQESSVFYGQLIDLGVDGILGARPLVARDTIDARGVAWSGEDPAVATTTTVVPSTTTNPVVPSTTTNPVVPSTTTNPSSTFTIPATSRSPKPGASARGRGAPAPAPGARAAAGRPTYTG